jgi:para-aminobenzoate synthetase component 2
VILLLDNYDSFTWNLVQRIGELDPSVEVRVVRNDEIDADGAEALAPERLIISPGPCTPTETGACASIIERMAGRVPILGVCLGHQTIGWMHDMTVSRAPLPVHGKVGLVHHDGRGLFEGLPQPFEATRYHSLIVERDSVDLDRFEISAWLEDGMVMGLRRRGEGAALDGVQFHPESFLSLAGPMLLANFIGCPRPGLETL